MPPKKYKKKVVTKRSMTVQGFNIQGSNNLIRNALVENNTAESGQAEEELIIQGFNVTEDSNNNTLENILARNNQVIAESYEPESDNEKANELKEKISQLKKGEKEVEKIFEELGLGLNNIKNVFKEEKGQNDNNKESQIDKSKPTLEYLIGKGGYGEVYRGKWKSQDVAIKKLHLLPNTSTSDKNIKEIKNEVNILKNLRNRHIIQYYGIYSNNQEFFIIMDYAENGTLTKFINDNKDKEHNWSFNTKLIRQITLGLNYIHHENIIHRDLKSSNILLAHGYQVKISDFGLSKAKHFSQSKDIKGTLEWMAPELLRGKKYSEQSDIYSLGMVIWEIATKCTTPFKDTDYNLVAFHIMDNRKETIPDNVPKEIRDIIEQCWKDNPSERITLANILEISDRLISQIVHVEHPKSSNFSKTQNSLETIDQLSSGLSSADSIKPLYPQNNVVKFNDINSNFTPEQIQQWTNHNFTALQCKEWLNIGLHPTEPHFAAYLRDQKHLTPETALNQADYEQLKEEYQSYQTEQEQPPK